jgi:hypothetical protein
MLRSVHEAVLLYGVRSSFPVTKSSDRILNYSCYKLHVHDLLENFSKLMQHVIQYIQNRLGGKHLNSNTYYYEMDCVS